MKNRIKKYYWFIFILFWFTGLSGYADPLVIISAVPTDASCGGYSDGSITITFSGGTPAYTISWTGGNSDTTSNSVYTITGLSKGTYWVVVDGSSFGETDSRFGIIVN